jgi:hypothetical protein
VFRLVLGTNDYLSFSLTLGSTGVSLSGYSEAIYGDNAICTCNPFAWIPCVNPTSAISEACTGQNALFDGSFDVVGTRTFRGVDTTEVGGVSVPSYHYFDARTIAGGSQAGMQELEWWFSVENGLLLREIIATTATSPTPLGKADYTETVDFSLQSMTPTALPAGDGGNL